MKRVHWLITLKLLLAVVLLTTACKTTLVLSEYGTRFAVSRNADGTVRVRKRPHRGVDILAYRVGDPAIASADGVVVETDFDKGAGGSITIYHWRHDRWTRYWHLERSDVQPGVRVRRGSVIGTVGLFPLSDGVIHVHWMLCTNPRCRGRGQLGGTADPMRLSVSCFESGQEYPADHLVLTYPVPCKE